MASAAFPAWQTGELEEEWVESSPSPPPPSIRKPNAPASAENLVPQTAESIRLKRGSLRALGHSAPRGLPPSRNASVNSASTPRVISGHGEGRVLSEQIANGQSDLPSPPNSQPGSDAEGVVGTFVVKDGVDDDRGAHLAKKGRDMFGPSALEKMFRPPSPVAPVQPEPTSPPAQQQSTSPTSSPPPLTSTTPSGPPYEAARRLSHPYAPINPSRLSKSVTPSSASTSFNGTNPLDEDSTRDATIPFAESSHNSLIVEEKHSGEEDEYDEEGSPARELNSGEVETDMSPPGMDEKFPFTFAAPRRAPKPVVTSSNHSTEFAPSPFHSNLASHSTFPKPPAGSSKPGLRLFRGTYDTYTREHLSALVDSIAIEASPSPPVTSPTNMRQWSSDSSRSRGLSEGSLSAESRTGSERLEDNDSRSSKRMRMSPVSPARQAPGVRDWGAQGRAMMARLRAMEDSTTSASQSRSSGSNTGKLPCCHQSTAYA